MVQHLGIVFTRFNYIVFVVKLAFRLGRGGFGGGRGGFGGRGRGRGGFGGRGGGRGRGNPRKSGSIQRSEGKHTTFDD